MNKQIVEIPMGKNFRDDDEKKALETYKTFYESMMSVNKKKKKTIPVKIVGIEPEINNQSPDMYYCAVCQYQDSDWKIIVPAGYMGLDMGDTENMSDMDIKNKYKAYIKKMLNATIDIVVLGIILAERKMAGSRAMAMEDLMNRNYFRNDENGLSRMERAFMQKKFVEAQVVTVAHSVVFVDIFGKIVRVLARDVDHRYVEDLKTVISVGDVVKVKITKLAIDKENQLIDIAVSIKDANENINLKNIKNYTENSEYMGTVTSIRDGYFVQIFGYQNGLTVFCRYVACPEMPNKGDQVMIKLTHLNKEKGRAFGEILSIEKRAALIA